MLGFLSYIWSFCIFCFYVFPRQYMFMSVTDLNMGSSTQSFTHITSEFLQRELYFFPWWTQKKIKRKLNKSSEHTD